MIVKGREEGMLGYCAQSCHGLAPTNPKNSGSLLGSSPPEASFQVSMGLSSLSPSAPVIPIQPRASHQPAVHAVQVPSLRSHPYCQYSFPPRQQGRQGTKTLGKALDINTVDKKRPRWLKPPGATARELAKKVENWPTAA